jgi:hypothetical protein
MSERQIKHCRAISPLGGNGRAKKLTPERRREIALLGARIRWKKYDEKNIQILS